MDGLITTDSVNSSISNVSLLNQSAWQLLDNATVPSGFKEGSAQALQLFVGLGILITNPFILIALRQLKNRRITLHYWIGHLALGDFLQGIFIQIRCILDIFNLQNSATCRFIQTAINTIFYTSMTGILAISVLSLKTARRASLVQPRQQNAKWLPCLQIAATWLVWTSFNTGSVLSHAPEAIFSRYECHLAAGVIPRYALTLRSIMVIIHVIGVTFCQIGIAKAIKKIRKNHQPQFAVTFNKTRMNQVQPQCSVGASSGNNNTESTKSTSLGIEQSIAKVPLDSQNDQEMPETSTPKPQGVKVADCTPTGLQVTTRSNVLTRHRQDLPGTSSDAEQAMSQVRTSQVVPSSTGTTLDHRLSRTELHLMQSIILVVTLFTLCYLPSACVLLVFSLYPEENNPVNERLVQVANIGMLINSMMNVFVYAQKSAEFRKIFKRIIKCDQRNSN